MTPSPTIARRATARRVRLTASGVNPSDVKAREGRTRKIGYPRVIPHSDGAGEIGGVRRSDDARAFDDASVLCDDAARDLRSADIDADVEHDVFLPISAQRRSASQHRRV